MDYTHLALHRGDKTKTFFFGLQGNWLLTLITTEAQLTVTNNGADYRQAITRVASEWLCYPNGEENKLYIIMPWQGVMRLPYKILSITIQEAVRRITGKTPSYHTVSPIIKQVVDNTTKSFDWNIGTPKVAFNNPYEPSMLVLNPETYEWEYKVLKYRQISQLPKDMIWDTPPNEFIDPELMCPMVWLDMRYEPNDEPPTNWLNFITRIMPDEHVRNIFQEFVGISLIPWINPQKALILIGPGANGKTTLLNMLRFIFGNHLVSALNIKDLSNNTLLGAIEDSIINISEENITIEKLIDSNAFKAIIGEGTVLVNPKYQPPYFVRPHARWILAVNDFPQFSETSEAIRRRLILLPMKQTIPPDERKPLDELIHSIRSERIQILRWFLEGAVRFIKRNNQFAISAEVLDMLYEWETYNSTVMYWLKEGAISGGEYSSSTLYEMYKNWCYESGFKPKSIRSFIKELELVGAKRFRTYNSRMIIIPEDILCFIRNYDNSEID